MPITISIEKSLLNRANKIARKKKLSRSQLFALALEEYIQRKQNRGLLEKINAAYANEPDADERIFRRKISRTHRRMVKDTW